MIENLVLSGGSIKGVTYFGLLKSIQEHPDIYKNIKCFAGASVGSLFSTFLALDIKYEYLEKFINTDFSQFLQLDIEDLIEKYGLDNGKAYVKLMEEVLGEYKDITFLGVFEKTGKRLIISATCLNNYNIEYFDYISHPKLKVVDAIRASISIPFLFTSVNMYGKTYIDGAILEPMPITLFDKEKTLGIWIVDKNYNHGYMGDLDCFKGFVYNFFVCIKKRLDTLNNFEAKYNILKISLENVSFLDFDMNIEKKNEIIEIGYNTMNDYIEKLKKG